MRFLRDTAIALVAGFAATLIVVVLAGPHLVVALTVGIAVSLLGGLIADQLAEHRTKKRPRTGRFSGRSSLDRLLSQLATGAAVEHFSRILGPHTFKNQHGSYHEFVFVHPAFYVQALVSDQDRVDFYAVTSRLKKFHPVLWGNQVYWTLEDTSKKLRLGEFSFADFPMKDVPDGIMGWLGARRFHWAEAYWFGNPGLYQTYVLAINDAGWVEPLESSLPMLRVPGAPFGIFSRQGNFSDAEVGQFISTDAMLSFRRSARPNTYGVLGPHLSLSDLLLFRELVSTIGPNLDQVRTFAG